MPGKPDPGLSANQVIGGDDQVRDHDTRSTDKRCRPRLGQPHRSARGDPGDLAPDKQIL